MFITLEGLDLSGKTTQAQLLVEPLRQSRVVRFLREPGGTRISERLRDILLDHAHQEMCDAAELFLFSASRAQLVTEVIRPALQRGEIVVCDRFYDSTTAYQGYGRGLDLEAVKQINALATSGTDPDLTFVIDIPVEEIELRTITSGGSKDRMESSGRLFYERVRKGYHALVANAPSHLVLLDGLLPVDEVHRQIWEAVLRHMHADELPTQRRSP
jgi:dTMP kinase